MTSWYVDPLASGAKTGLSWSDAWTNFASIRWLNIKPGDTLYLSGGQQSQIYPETLILTSAVGAADAFVTVDIGANSPQPQGHAGSVVLDGGGVRQNCILATANTAYVRVNGLACRNVTHDWQTARSMAVRAYLGHHIYFDNLDIQHDGTWGVVFDNLSSSRVHNCSIVTSGQKETNQGNGIYTQNGYSNVIENNFIFEQNTADLPVYWDCLQIYGDTDITVRNNILKWAVGAGTSNCGTLMVDVCRGTSLFYNNVALGCSLDPFEMWQYEGIDVAGQLHIYNNTLIAQHPTSSKNIHVNNAGSQTGIAAIRNNILVSAQGRLMVLELGLDPAKCDNNLMFTGGTSYVQLSGGQQKNWQQWQAAGYDPHGVNADPQLDADCRPKSTSPCIGKGADLSAYFSADLDGNPRPVGPWTIGAYEYIEPPVDELAELKARVDAQDVRLAELEALRERIEIAFGG